MPLPQQSIPATPVRRTEPPPALLPVALLFFFSGALALMYEVVWQRQFALLFGSAAPATAAVLAAYFAGLGAGSFVMGRMAARWSNPLRVYAVLEILIGAGALLVIAFQRLFEAAYPALFHAMENRAGSFFLIKLTLVFVALLLPTFCMGATLPALGRLMDGGSRRLGVTAGLLYVANTAGASLGALTVPFVLLPVLGGSGTVWFCVAGNMVLALTAWWWSPRLASRPASAVVQQAPPRRPSRTDDAVRLPVLALACVSGVATFALQVLWNRAFAQVHENSVHSFALIVAVVILALALGGQLARAGLRRGFAPRQLIAGSWCLAGLGVATGPFLFVWLTDGLAYLPAERGWAGYAGPLFVLATAVLLVPMTLLGIGLPAILEEAGRDGRCAVSAVLGRLLAINVAGSVAGALFAGFVLPRWLGLWSAVVLIGALLVLAGLATWVGVPAAGRQRWRLAGLAGLLLLSAWSASKVNLPRVQLATFQGERLLAIAEGSHGITAVVERPGSRRLKHNNHYILGGTAAAGDERAQAHLPLLLHPDPQRVAFLGTGTGITAGGALFHPVKRITAIELVPEAAALARHHFSQANAGVLNDPRTTVVIEDARNFLRGTREKFDVIVGDLIVPWRQGEGALLTLEQFEAARAALAPSGLFCQWLPLFQLSEAEAAILLRTFLTVFPNATLWRGDFSPSEPALALVGGNDLFKLDPGLIRERVAAMSSDPLNPHLAHPAALWMHFAGDVSLAGFPSRETRINRDDWPLIELMGPLHRGRREEDHALVGWRLRDWLKTLNKHASPILAGLHPEERAGVEGGDLLSEMMRLLAEGNPAGAEQVRMRLQNTLPPAVFLQLFDPAP